MLIRGSLIRHQLLLSRGNLGKATSVFAWRWFFCTPITRTGNAPLILRLNWSPRQLMTLYWALTVDPPSPGKSIVFHYRSSWVTGLSMSCYGRCTGMNLTSQLLLTGGRRADSHENEPPCSSAPRPASRGARRGTAGVGAHARGGGRLRAPGPKGCAAAVPDGAGLACGGKAEGRWAHNPHPWVCSEPVGLDCSSLTSEPT